MFHTDESWDLNDQLLVMRKLFNQPNLRRHRIVEVPHNVELFHVDVMMRSQPLDDPKWQRFICSDCQTAVSFLASQNVLRSRVSRQTRQSEIERYSIEKIVEIRASISEETLLSHGYVTELGVRYVESGLERRNAWEAASVVWRQNC